jgi:hypothetical protein
MSARQVEVWSRLLRARQGDLEGKNIVDRHQAAAALERIATLAFEQGLDYPHRTCALSSDAPAATRRSRE